MLVSSIVSLRESMEMGYGLVVFIDIKVGDIVVVEKSYVLVNFLERE